MVVEETSLNYYCSHLKVTDFPISVYIVG